MCYVNKVCRAFLFVLIFAGMGSAVGAEEKVDGMLTFGVVPQQSATQLARVWGPLLKYLEQETQIKFVFRTGPDIPAFEQRVEAGEYDFVYFNPYHYTVFHEQPGYVAFAKAKDRRIHGIIVVAKDSPINSVEQLEGMTLAFPAPAAFAASMLPRANLSGRGIAFTEKYVSSHDSVYRTVAEGVYPAGGGIVRTLQAIDPAVRDKLRILWTTPGYTSHAFAAHPDIPRAQVEKVQEALAGMHLNPEGAEILSALKVKGFEVAEDGDWDDVRALNLRTTLGRQ